ncbi:unnamed protein product [Sphagnum jensenii]|uniref:mRNA export factor GLE1 n=1 Tax=Sphagnum jensenii TaxID=128206 RepID=A0ABP0VQ54_9BRYO
MVDPNPDWTLEELQQELEALSKQGDNKNVRTDGCDSCLILLLHFCRVSWRELSVTADFGRTTGPFIMRAFDSDSDEDSDEEERKSAPLVENKSSARPVQNQRDKKGAGSPLLACTEYVEAALIELERERLTRVQEEFRKRRLSLNRVLREEIVREAAVLTLVEKDKEAKCELARRSDKQDQRMIAEARDVHLSALQRDHELRSQSEARQIRKEAAEEEARRREIAAREERERQLKARIEADAKKKADAEKAKADAEKVRIDAEARERKAQADTAARAALQRVEAEQKAKQEAQRKASASTGQAKQPVEKTTTTGSRPRVAPTAAKLEEARKQKLQELQEMFKPLQANPANQKELKVYERQVIKHLQQVAATQEQVKKKSMDLLQLLCDPRAPTQFLIVTLGAKLLSQCESQILKLPSFAFALAQVIVNVASQVPYVMDVVLAKLHEVCIFTTPKYYVFSKDQFSSDESYYKALGYREEDGKLESTDDYVARMTAYMTFYGAMTQTDYSGGQNPHGLADGWTWCARLLNHIPSNRSSASALEAFLKMAGFRLYQVYPKPFMKVMQTMVSEFIVNLKSAGDPDSRAVVTRLETYLHHQKYLVEPEGRKMPATDISSSMKA